MQPPSADTPNLVLLTVSGSYRKWAVAGRDRAKLEALAASLGGGAAPGVVVADVAAPDSLLAMAR